MKFNDPIKRPCLDLYTKEEVLAMLPNEYEAIYHRHRYLSRRGRLGELTKRPLERMKIEPVAKIVCRPAPSTIQTRKLQGMPIEKFIRAINGGL